MDKAALSRELYAGLKHGYYLNDYVFGRGMFDPAYPTHGAIRRCPFCDEPYRVHGGFSDHRDECDEGPCPGANPVY
jgi:hypothetical protein